MISGQQQTIKGNNNSLHKSCKFHINSNHTAAATIDVTKVDRFQLTRSSLGSINMMIHTKKCKMISQHTTNTNCK